jgi:hypothetical protein
MSEEESEWAKIWNARLAALENVLGPSDDLVFHAAHPFELGGQADVVRFSKHLRGYVYTTAELSGPGERRYADYELMICTRDHDDWGPNIISRLAPYTQEAEILAGETMDIDRAVPHGSSIAAFLFDTYATSRAFGTDFDLRVCVGITREELAFKFEHEAAALLELLKRHGVYPFTDLSRHSVPLA